LGGGREIGIIETKSLDQASLWLNPSAIFSSSSLINTFNQAFYVIKPDLILVVFYLN
jgi:hypothetical protein